MGIWDRFSSRKTESDRTDDNISWKELSEGEQLEDIVATSFKRPQVIFKHSRTCGISSMARRRFEKTAEHHGDRLGFHVLVIQDNRELSNTISSRFEIRHESPQLLIIKEGRVVQHASHWQIEAVDLEDYQ